MIKLLTLYDYLQKQHETHDETQGIKYHCQKALELLHTKGYCHGDFRSNNILIRHSETPKPIAIVDFDWSGETDKATYPPFINHIDINWPEGATDNALLQPDHDNYWLNQALP